MANSYIEYRNRSARINDQILTVIVLLAADAERAQGGKGVASALVNEWPAAAIDAPPGLIRIDLSDFWVSDLGESTLRAILDNVEIKIESFGDRIPAKVSDCLAGSKGVRFVDIESKLVVDALNKWRSLLVKNEKQERE
jgi:hypothetical protein